MIHLKRTSVPDSSIDEYARLAPDYDRRWAAYVRVTTEQTLARLNFEPGHSILDVGCGTGALLAELSKSHFPGKLAGVDPVPEMLALARTRLPAAVTLSEGRAERLPFSSQQFDRVVSCNAFHHFTAPLTALHEMTRVLRPGGMLVITDWCHDYLACRLCTSYLRLVKRMNIKTLRVRECRELFSAAGSGEPEIMRYRISPMWGLMTAKAVKQLECIAG